MPYFKDADEVYEFIGQLFADLAEDDDLGPKFRKANTIVQYRYTNPESQITVKMSSWCRSPSLPPTSAWRWRR